jgi:uncharacterized phage-associated protein
MIITHHREKIINAISYFATNTRNCGKTKLMKLLFFLDFCHFKQTGKSVTGLEYYAWRRGPVPKDLFRELDDMKPDLKAAINVVPTESFHKIIPKKKFSATHFTDREIRLLENLSFIFKDAKAQDMVEVSHLRNTPWDKTLKEKGQNQKIDYLLAVDSMEDSLPYDEAKERMEEISEVHEVLGTA